MRIDILSLFPEMFGGVFGCSITKRAIEKKYFRYTNNKILVILLFNKA